MGERQENGKSVLTHLLSVPSSCSPGMYRPSSFRASLLAMREEMAGQHYCLRWNNYQSNMTSVFHHLLRTQAFVDVTLACNEHSLKAHKVVLSACSSYFQKLLLENPCKHPTIIMPQDVCFTDLKFIIEFVYRGEIDVSQAELQSLLKTADQLKIKGLCEVEEGKESVGAEVTPLPPAPPPRKSLRQRRLKRRTARSNQYRERMKARPPGQIGDCLEMTDENECEDRKDVNGVGNQQQVVVVEHAQGLEATAIMMGSPSSILPQPIQAPAPHQVIVDATGIDVDDDGVKVKFETLRAIDQSDHMEMDHHITDRAVQAVTDDDHAMHTMMITPELLGLIPSSSSSSQAESGGGNGSGGGGGSQGVSNGDLGVSGMKVGKSWSQEDMEGALEALRTQRMSLTKASLHYGIPSTTLWQRAHRLGIDTPKKDGPAKSWTEDSLNIALDALRSGTISANKASKAYGIPSSTLYKIARREGIRLAAPFNAAPTTWNPDDLERALEAIRSGQSTVQRAATEFGIPSGTLYGRCKREGIELSRSNPTPWSEDAMTEALEAVRVGQMSINQAAIHYNLPYSSLYGRFKRGKYEGMDGVGVDGEGLMAPQEVPPQIMLVQYQQAPPAIHMYQA